MEIVLFWFVCAVAAGVVAASKGRSGLGWFFLSLLLFGILGLLIVGLMPSLNKPEPARADVDTRERVPCPSCREFVVKGAEVCRFCGAAQQVAAVAAPKAGAGRVTCVNCGRNYPAGQKVCGCGMTLR